MSRGRAGTFALGAALGLTLVAGAPSAGSAAIAAGGTAPSTVSAPALGPTPAKKKRKTPRRVEVVLGLHNIESGPAAQDHLAPQSPPVPDRLTCGAVMTRSTAELTFIARLLEGHPVMLAGCGSSPSSWKYPGSRMGGFNRKKDWARDYKKLAALRTSAATPTPAAYEKYLLRVKAAFGDQLEMWEVWNEAELATFYRGTPKDLVDLTFVAAKVFGRKHVAAPSWCPCSIPVPDAPSGAWVKGRYLTRGEFITAYWTNLVAESRRRGVALPLSVLNMHGYGAGLTPREAAEDRIMKIKAFKKQAKSLIGRRYRSLQLWDSEWNLRFGDGDPRPPERGFPDTRRNARIWAKSARDAACLGVDRQYSYRWLDDPALPGSFESLQLQMNPSTPWLNAAFARTQGRTVTCP